MNVQSLLGRAVALVCVAFVCVATLLGASPAATPPPALAAEVLGETPVKYYVVGSPVNAVPEYLFAIAEKTLGNGRRYPEIFELNKNRRQRDGRYLTDPSVLEPGWALLLPSDAHGPAVLVGPLSAVTFPEPSSRPAANGYMTPPTPYSATTVLRAFALTVMVALLGLALRLLRPGTRRARLDVVNAGPRRAEVPATAPPEDGDVHTTVLAGDAMLSVHLVGSRGTPSHTWTGSGPWPQGSAPVTLGTGRKGTLVVDLAACPDVVTLTGLPRFRRRQAASWAAQLCELTIPVIVVGDTLAGVLPSGCRTVATLDDLLATNAPPHSDVEVAFCASWEVDGNHGLDAFLKRSSPRLVIVVLGHTRRSRWSVDARPASIDYVPAGAQSGVFSG